MSTDIQRLRYYNREYLAAPDFQAEQDYHVEMRRRLNIALHLWGIVEGLEICETEIVPGAPKQAAIMPGMAIDGYGREIVVRASVPITEEFLKDRRAAGGQHSVWLVYKREATTPPTPGFRDCQLADQYTRWSESFDVVFEEPKYNPPGETDLPPAAGPVARNGAKDYWPIKLGEINYNPAADPKIKPGVNLDGRIYIGLRAQRLATPAQVADDDFKILGAQTASDPPTSIAAGANLFCQKNLIVGENFAVAPPPKPPTGAKCPTSAVGNAKLSSDLFLQGNLYMQAMGAAAKEWMSLKDIIKTLVPETHTGSKEIEIEATQTRLTNRPAAFVVTSARLLNVNKAEISAWIAGVTWRTQKEVTDMMALPDNGKSPEVQAVTSALASKQGPTKYDITVYFDIGPVVQTQAATGTAPAEFKSPIQKITIGYAVTFYP